jgi:hypothetical protein
VQFQPCILSRVFGDLEILRERKAMPISVANRVADQKAIATAAYPLLLIRHHFQGEERQEAHSGQDIHGVDGLPPAQMGHVGWRSDAHQEPVLVDGNETQIEELEGQRRHPCAHNGPAEIFVPELPRRLRHQRTGRQSLFATSLSSIPPLSLPPLLPCCQGCVRRAW